MNDLGKLEEGLSVIERAVGLNWFKKWVHRLKEYCPDVSAMGRFLDPQDAGLPPLAYLWYDAREELALLQIGCSQGLGYAGQRIIELAGILKTIENAGLPAGAEFLGSVNFESVLYKMKIASQYIRSGIEVDILWPGDRQQGPDLVLDKNVRLACSRTFNHDKPGNSFLERDLEDIARRLKGPYPSLLYLDMEPDVQENRDSLGDKFLCYSNTINRLLAMGKFDPAGGVALTSTMYIKNRRGVEMIECLKITYHPNPRYPLPQWHILKWPADISPCIRSGAR